MFDYRSMFDLDGKSALVVGAGSGIGEASAQGLAAFGASVVCADVDAEAAKNTAGEISSEGGEAEALELDMTDPRSVDAAVERVGTPDVLVSTPSVNVRKPVLEITDEEFDQIIDLNLKGTFRLIRNFGRGMAERGSGSIIAFSSIRGQVVEPGQGIYAATKAGTVQMLRALASEVGPRGVQGKRHRPRHRRDAAYGTDQRLSRLVRLLRRQEHLRPLGPAARDGRHGRLPRLGGEFLRHGRLHARRRWLDRGRRTVHPATVGKGGTSGRFRLPHSKFNADTPIHI